MKKFRKLLIFLLALVCIATVITVTVLADEEKIVFEYFNNDFDSEEIGKSHETNPNGEGYFKTAEWDYGNDPKNKYLLYYKEAGTGNASYRSMNPRDPNYKIVNYPYMMLDFDISKLTDNYALNSFYTLVWSDHTSGTQRPYSNTLIFDDFDEYFPKSKYEWAHVSIIFAYEPTEESNDVNVYVYVNGENVYTKPQYLILNPGTLNGADYTLDNLYFGENRLNNRYSSASNKTAYDRLKLSYFSKGYSLEEVAAYYYQDGYEFPYGMTRANVDGTEYENIKDAVDAASSSGNSIQITADITDTIKISNKNLIFDTNKYDEDNLPTNEYYSVNFDAGTYAILNNDGIITFADSTFEVTADDGVTKTYYTADKFASFFTDTSFSGSTVKLLSDLDINVGTINPTNSLTLDLNGFDIKRTNIYGTVYNYVTGDTTDEVLSSTKSEASMFKIGSNVSLTIMSSEEGSDFYIHSMKRDSWIDETGKEIKFTTGTPDSTSLIYITTNVTFNLKGISVYATSFINNAWASNTGVNVKVENCKLYRTESGTTGTPAFYFCTSKNNAGTVLIKDCFIYSAIDNAYFIRQDGGSTEGCGLDVTFENCDLFYNRTGVMGHNQLTHGSSMQKFVNCRYYWAYFNSTYAGEFYEGSLIKPRNSADYDKIVAALPRGLAIRATNATETYTHPKTVTSPLDENGYPTFSFEMTSSTVAFEYEVYQLPVLAMIGDVKYYDVSEAFAVLSEGDTITLFADISETLNVTFPISIDTNEYDSNGQKTGKQFNINYSIPSHYAAKNNDGIINIGIDTEKPVKVYWDACPGDTCECDHSISGHPLYSVSEYVYGQIPSKELNLFANGYDIVLSGWSSTPGGDPVEFAAISEEDLINGTLYFYPIIESYTKYDIQVVAQDGSYTLHYGNEYESVMNNAASGSTVILYSDIDTDAQAIAVKKNRTLTLDMNGYDIRLSRVWTINYLYGNGDSKDTVIDGIAGSDTIFNFASGYTNSNLTITSSRDGSDFYTAVKRYNNWYADEAKTTLKKSSTSYGTSTFAYVYTSDLSLNVSNVSIYATTFIRDEHKSLSKLNVDINNCKFYRMFEGTPSSSYPIFYFATYQSDGGIANIKNSFFYDTYGGGFFLRKDGIVDNTVDTQYGGMKVTFENCDIFNGAATKSYIQNRHDVENLVFSNCRLYGVSFNSTYGAVVKDSTHFTVAGSNKFIIDDGDSIQPSSRTVNYYFPNITKFTINEETGNFDFTFEWVTTTAQDPETKEYYEIPLEFDYFIANNAEECVFITWMHPDGYVIATSYALKNSTAIVPAFKIAQGDGFRAFTNVAGWLLNGALSDLSVGEDESYTFTAVIPEYSDKTFVSQVTNAMFNMVYYNDFAYYVYVPKVEGVIYKTLGDGAPITTAFISDVEYWVYSVTVPVYEALEDCAVTFSYIIDSQLFTTTFKPSALVYANTILADPRSSALEKQVVGNLIRYVDEAYKSTSKHTTETEEKVAAFYARYTPEEYRSEYVPDAVFDNTVYGEDGFSYIKSVSLIMEGGSVRFAFDIWDITVANGYRVVVENLSDSLTEEELEYVYEGNTEIGKRYLTGSLPLRTHIMKSLQVSLVDADGNVLYFNGMPATSYYSVATYLSEMTNSEENIDIVRALYEFGDSALRYHPVKLEEYTDLTLNGESIDDYTIAADKSDAAEYLAAIKLQQLLHKKTGHWHEIVPSSEADRSMVLSLVPKTGDLGFTADFGNGRIEIECEYANSIEKTLISLFNEKFENAEGSLDLTDNDSCEINVRDVYYSQFGAVGDGVTDDSEAIRACHQFANVGGHMVYADEGATYYIGPMEDEIYVKTNTNWGNSNFIIDDSVIPYNSSLRTQDVFCITRDSDSVNSFSTSTANDEHSQAAMLKAFMKALNANKTNGIAIDASECTKLDLALGYPAILNFANANHNNYIREGANQNDGDSQHELVLIDAYGNIDPSTPFMFDYTEVTSISVYPVDDTTITVEGGIFTTIANIGNPDGDPNSYINPCNPYNQYDRGIKISRSNTVLKNVTHYVTGEGEYGCPYGAFIDPHYVYNFLAVDCKVTGHHEYQRYTKASPTKLVGNGSYDITSSSSIKVTFKDCVQTNFFSDDAETKLTGNLWGIMGSSYSKDVTFDGCTLSRFDAHAGMWGLKIVDSRIQYITVVGGGPMYVENTEFWKSEMLQLRSDYGNFWDGDALFKNITIKSTASEIYLLKCGWKDWDYGYPRVLPNITIDGITLANSNSKVYLFQTGFLNVCNNIESGTNKLGAPEYYIIKNITNGTKDNFVVPDKKTYTYFANTTFSIDDTEY